MFLVNVLIPYMKLEFRQLDAVHAIIVQNSDSSYQRCILYLDYY